MVEPIVFGMTEDEWYAQGNPPGSFDDVIRMGEENARKLYRSALAPHLWDQFDEELATRRITGEPS